jgi:predicted transcriptional regulator
MANAAATLITVFRENEGVFTMQDLMPLAASLRKNEISMALCYLLKQGYLSRQKVDRQGSRGRKEVWAYTFHADRQRSKEINE